MYRKTYENRNPEHYKDLTPYRATNNVTRQKRNELLSKRLDHDYRECIHLLLSIVDKCGFEFACKIELRHKKTGRIL